MLLLAGALLWPAVLNRAPILFPDSVGYFRSGEASLGVASRLIQPRTAAHLPAAPEEQLDTRGDGVSTQRSVFYGAVVASQYRLGGIWLVVATQCAIVALTLILALRRLGMAGWEASIVAAAIVTTSGLALFSSAVMPDVYLGLMLLSIALLFAYGDVMRLGERLWFAAMVVAAVLFHRAHLAVAGGAIALAVPLLMLARRRWRFTTFYLGAILVTASFSHSAVDFMVQRVTGKPPVVMPFLLARLIGDGTAVSYLERKCPTQSWASCRILGHTPMSADDFLWGRDPTRGEFGAVGLDQRERISGEEKSIVIGALRYRPVVQLFRSAQNAFEQFFVVGATEFQRPVVIGLSPNSTMSSTLIAYQDSRIAHHLMPLPGLSQLMLVVYIAALAVAVAVGALQLRVHRPAGEPTEAALARRRYWIAAGIVAEGLILNAAVNGVLSGVFDRYQGRAAWLALLFASVAVAMRLKDLGWRTAWDGRARL